MSRKTVICAGDISLPLVGALHVAGLSPVRVEELIAKKLVDGNFYKNPQVSVMVKEYSTQGLYVLGEVQKPGLYSVLQAHSLLQAISLAGGTTPKAGRPAENRHDHRQRSGCQHRGTRPSPGRGPAKHFQRRWECPR